MTKLTFTRRHFIKLADALRTVGIYAAPKQEEGVRFTIENLCRFFESENPNFDKERFMKAVMK